MSTELIVQLGATFTVITTTIISVLKYNSEKFKTKVDDDTVKRKEISALLESLYTATKEELTETKKSHKEEIEQLKRDHVAEMKRRDEHNADEIRKRDIIIAELISRLAPEAQRAVENKMHEINLNIIKQ